VGDRFIDRLEAIRSAAKVWDGSKTVAGTNGDDVEVRGKRWSRGRELNPRPTDYEWPAPVFAHSSSVAYLRQNVLAREHFRGIDC